MGKNVNQLYYVGILNGNVIDVIFTSLSACAVSLGVSVGSAQSGKRKWRNKEIIVCKMEKCKRPGRSLTGGKDIEQTRMGKWRTDITFDENI